MAVCEASQWVEATTPWVPVISGRVVNWLMRILCEGKYFSVEV
jgi:hypothetical protein